MYILWDFCIDGRHKSSLPGGRLHEAPPSESTCCILILEVHFCYCTAVRVFFWSGWSYYGSQSRYADTGMAGRPKDEGLLVHRSRGRVWFRVAATPGVAKAVEVRVQQQTILDYASTELRV